MSTTIDQAFIKQYEAEVHAAYQRMGTKLKGTVRTKSGVVGTSVTWQKVGKGTAGQKTRHGLVPVMNVEHSNVEAILADYYAGDWVDKLDEIKTNIDERQVLARAGAWALGRKCDEQIIAAARASLPSGQKIAVNTSGLTRAKVQQAIEKLNAADVPDDGDRFAIVGPHQWEELLTISQFVSSDMVGEEYPWLKGTEARRWRNTVWIVHSGLPLSSTTRYCLMYHKTAIGWAEGADITADITWHGDRASHFINHMMSGGAVRIDDTGVVEIACDDTAAIP